MKYKESEIVELKSQITSEISKEVIAFANTKGGTIYIGVKDDGSIIGVDNIDNGILQLNNMIRDSIKPDITMFVSYNVVKHEEKIIITIKVQKGTDRPYYLANKGMKPLGVYVRNGTSSEPSTETGIRKMIKATDGDCFEEMRSLEQNLTFDVANKEFTKRNLEFSQAKMISLGIMSIDHVYTNLGFLLSDQCIDTIKVATFSGKDKVNFQDRNEFTGSLFQQMEDLYYYLNLRNKTKATFDGLYRIDKRDYPDEAVREAMLNCIVHKDYAYHASTLVSVFDDRIEFVSIGGLPEGIETEDILMGLSLCRNTKLASVFYRLQLIEAYGTGIPKIFSAYENTNFTPKIQVTSNAFKITLPNLNVKIEAHETNNGMEDKVISYLSKHEYITRADTEFLLGMSQATSNRLLKRMVEYGILIQVGNGKNTRYKTTN